MQISERAKLKKNSYDSETRTCNAVAATESPVEVFDLYSGRLIREVLLMSGCEYPEQVPLLDTHSRHSVSSIMGNAGQFSIQGDELHCQITLSTDARAKNTATKIEEGHLDSLSVGYEVIRAEHVEEGQTKFYGQKAVEGPCQVTTRWRIKEISVCPIGADDRAKIRSYNNTGGNKMQKEDLKKTGLENSRDEQVRTEERQRVREISAMGARFNCSQLAETMVESGASVEQARQRVMDFLERTDQGGPSFKVDVTQTDEHKRSAAMTDGLLMKSGVRLEKPAPGADEFQGRSLVDVARECLNMGGVNARSWNSTRIVKEALTMRAHSTSDFTAILSNVSGKALRTEYEQSPSTYEQWVNITNAPDFKELSRAQLSEFEGLDTIPELGEYTYGTFSDNQEVYAIKTMGKLFSISRQAIINDDLGAFTRIPRAFARTARREVNSEVYQILIDNNNMADGIALFHSDHKNLTGTPADPSIATLSAARTAMRLQEGMKGVILNVFPKFMIVPAELETISDQLLNTTLGFDASEGQGTVNPFYKKLELIVEPMLDGATGKPWFIACDPRVCDTIELAFLNGVTTPYLETRDGWTVDGVEFKVRLDFGAKALDHRGLHKVPTE